MKFTPDYIVSYKGVFHPAGKPFDIDEKDASEMQRHGRAERGTAEEQAQEHAHPRRTARK